VNVLSALIVLSVLSVRLCQLTEMHVHVALHAPLTCMACDVMRCLRQNATLLEGQSRCHVALFGVELPSV
jgi:hypothetical protein